MKLSPHILSNYLGRDGGEHLSFFFSEQILRPLYKNVWKIPTFAIAIADLDLF